MCGARESPEGSASGPDIEDTSERGALACQTVETAPMTESNLGAIVGGPARDALRAIAELLAPGSWEWAQSLAMAFDRAAGLESLLARVGDNITETGVSLAWLDSDSDTFLIALVPSVHGATLVELALAAGHCVRVF
jgi:hypothetical protein